MRRHGCVGAGMGSEEWETTDQLVSPCGSEDRPVGRPRTVPYDPSVRFLGGTGDVPS